MRTALVRTRHPGRTIVDEARRLGSEVIYLGPTHGAPAEGPLGPTARYVLGERPCRVIIASAPAAAPNGEAPEAPPRPRAALTPS